MATMADVARAAGVSTTTVSHVLNRTRPVSDATVARVQAAIEQTGYSHNTIARALARGGRTAAQHDARARRGVPQRAGAQRPAVRRGAGDRRRVATRGRPRGGAAALRAGRAAVGADRRQQRDDDRDPARAAPARPAGAR